MLSKESLQKQLNLIVDKVESYYSSDLVFNLVHEYYTDFFLDPRIIHPEEIYDKIKRIENVLQIIDNNKFPRDIEILKETKEFLLYWNKHLKLSNVFDWSYSLN